MTSVGSGFAMFDGDDGGAILLSDYRRALRFEGAGSPLSVFAAIEAASAQGEWVVLVADYALAASFDPAVVSAGLGHPLLRGWVFGQARRLDASAVDAFLDQGLSTIPEFDRVAGVAELSPALDEASYAAKIGQILRWIADGECYQVNLTFPIDFRSFGHPLALYARLRQRQPVRYGGFVSVPGDTLLSFSPELFFERTGSRVVTRPMKGTAPRGASPEEDEANRQALLASAKERAENVMIVDLLRNDLGRLAAPGEVRVESLCVAEAYPTLWQMVSAIAADLPGVSLFQLFKALFPCGSITGAPKIAAMHKITALEVSPRGLYTGALGWVAPSGDCRFNVAIRTFELMPDGRGRLGVGSGVVIDSNPVGEYNECLLKGRFLTGFDPGFELIETMCLEEGKYPLLLLHLERLETSARSLGFLCDMAAIRGGLAELAAAKATGTHRVRLTLGHSGVWRISSVEMPLDDSPKFVILADEVLDPDDYLLRHKTTARSRYDRVLQALADRPDVFDAVFLNFRGEVCEGARSNVFVERNGMLLTPPLACGLLPGVMRRYLLDTGRAVEQVLTSDDLLDAPKIYLANALRGLIPVTLLGA